MQTWRQLTATGLTLLLLGCYPLAQAAPAVKLWDRWNAFNPASSATIDHRPWHSWLETFVVSAADGINRVAYGQVTVADRTRLRAYIDSLTALSISDFKRDQQRAYWINLYNALTIDIVLEHFPLNSIRDISRGLFSSGPWRLKLATIEGEALTLDDIEHRILRPIWRDPRIHYALNCASLGCPNLQPVAFTSANTETLLESSARDFINHPRGASVIDKRLKVSRIYDWFEQDFGGNEAGVINHLRQYANDGLAAALDPIEDIGDYAYDWQINAQE